MTVEIKIQNLKKNFDDVNAVKGLNLTIDKGEMFGFLVPKGAGKTTTMSGGKKDIRLGISLHVFANAIL